VPRKQYQAEKRQELRQTDQAEIDEATGHLIDLPAHADDDHLGGDGSAKSCTQEQGEIAMAQHRDTTIMVARIQDCL
jgi:hypothetical protein